MEQKRLPMNAETVRALMRLVDENSLSELVLQGEDYYVALKAEGAAQGVVARPTKAAAATTEAPAETIAGIKVCAPMTGVYYRAPAPTEPPFIEPGDMVEVGQVIGLIEAMKVFSEVPSDAAGRVLTLPVKNGQLVHEGDVLVVLAPADDVVV